jgi:hypothetical protein
MKRFITCLLVIGFSASVSAYDVERARNNFTMEIVECSAFYAVAGLCVAQTKPNHPVVDQLFDKSETMMAYSIGLTSDEVSTKRFLLVREDMYKTLDKASPQKRCNNISVLMETYLQRCNALVENPSSGIQKWLDMKD